MDDRHDGSFSALFDFSFTSFVTLKLIKVLYVIIMILAAVSVVGTIIVGFQASNTMGILALVLSPLLFIIYILLARVWMELIVVFFRIEENTRKA
jgi:hypothetical protein